MFLICFIFSNGIVGIVLTESKLCQEHPDLEKSLGVPGRAGASCRDLLHGVGTTAVLTPAEAWKSVSMKPGGEV